MNYDEALEYINYLQIFGIKTGLDRLKVLLDKMGNPQKELKFIHIAGTNGKGSTSYMTSNILKKAGYKTGLYTSPYVLNYRDRIQINNNMISENEFADCITYIKGFVDDMLDTYESPTKFEIETAVAFEWFKRNQCDIVCLEVGLGGRLDATNIIDNALIQVITSIGLDHINILGNTLYDIAKEKSGIIKNSPTIMYPIQEEVVEEVIKNKCAEQNSKLIIADINNLKLLDDSWSNKEFVYNGLKIEKSLYGLYQVYNTITVYEIIRELNNQGFKITTENLLYGIKNTILPARMEVLCDNPLVILDGAHNSSGIKALEQTLKTFKDKKVNIIMGILSDKDYDITLKIIAPYINKFIAVEPPSPRALKSIDLCNYAKKYCSDSFSFENLNDAVDFGLKDCTEDDVLIVCGSLYLVPLIRPILKEKIKEK